MADAVFDFSELTLLAEQVSRVEREVVRGLQPVGESAAFTVKEGWQKSLEGSDVPASASTVEYDVKVDGLAVTATVANTHGSAQLRGYSTAREYGSPTVAPKLDAQNATAAGVADLERRLAIAGDRALRRALGA